MTITERVILHMEIDCHDHPYHIEDDYFPECGPDYLVGLAEKYGMLIRYVGEGFGWVYIIQGPREHLIRFLTDEYCGDEWNAIEMVDECAEVVQ
jgi:hypothetical protein